MFTTEDREKYLNNPAYSMALEKFYAPDYYGVLDDYMLDKTKRHNSTLIKAYPYSNENLICLFKNLKVKNARVLTVGSSGDQMLNALYYGSKDVTVMDANLYTKHWIDYKIAAIKNLSFDQFLQYFFDGFVKGEMFSWECYSQFFHDLPEDSQVFWGTIFADPNLSPAQIFVNIIGRRDAGTTYAISDFYETRKAYDRLAMLLNKCNYNFQVINAEFNEFKDVLGDNKYDVILLSNIGDYIPLGKYVPIVNSLYDKVLNPGGQMQVGYSFGSARSIREFFLAKHPKVVQFLLGESTTLLSKPSVAEIERDDASSMDRD